MGRNPFTVRSVAVIVGLLASQLPLPSIIGQARADDPVSRRVELLEKRVAELERELLGQRIDRANDRVLERLRGRWSEVSFTAEGRRQRGPDEVEWDLQSDAGSSRTVLAAGVSVYGLGAMSVDATKTPMWITFTTRGEQGKDRVVRGVVALKHVYTGSKRQTEATIAIPMSQVTGLGFDRDRPPSFESTVKNGIMVFELVQSD